MPRTVSVASAAAMAAQQTLPGYFVSIGWAPPVYLTTRGDTTWNSIAWEGAALTVSGLEWLTGAEQRGSLVLGNTDGRFARRALEEGAADIAIRIWVFDAAATATDDPVAVFDGSGDVCDVTERSVTISLTSRRSRSLFSPRTYITRDNGFSIVPPTGKTIVWANEKYVFKRA